MDYKDAFGDSKFKTYIKNAITEYLIKYFAAYYNKSNMSSLPTYMYTPIYRQDDLFSNKKVGSFSPVYQCPVNLKTTNEKGKNIKSGDSCKTSRCRFCWLAKDEAVTYGGALMGINKNLIALIGASAAVGLLKKKGGDKVYIALAPEYPHFFR